MRIMFQIFYYIYFINLCTLIISYQIVHCKHFCIFLITFDSLSAIENTCSIVFHFITNVTLRIFIIIRLNSLSSKHYINAGIILNFALTFHYCYKQSQDYQQVLKTYLTTGLKWRCDRSVDI